MLFPCFNYCSKYVWLFHNKWFICLFVELLLFYIQFFDRFFTCFDLYFFIWIIAVGMILAVLQEVITLYDYLVSGSLTDFILTEICIFFHFIRIFVADMLLIVFTRSLLSVWLSNDFNHIFSIFFNSLPVYICFYFSSFDFL